ncbi:hypothetical protein VPNG_07838 [Cytospora leucostoma]|uniref:Uncharacterized protein n=1 Tax=Cytospora leucostoma TaxID=1230097 RepID=A0A423WGW6_9PEZI|nr:hypothetical protein VPNG_07838 [Cytospora leucostoma]
MPGNGISSKQKPESMTWGPKISGSVKSSHIGGTIGANISVAPIEASASVLFKTESENGAVLTSESPVTRHAIGEERSAVQWMVDNKSEMLRLHGDVFKRHGIWIITKTYSTRRCAIAVMTARSSSVEISLDADAQGVLTLTPKSAWSSSTGSCCTEVHEDEEDGVVVYISGIYFSPKLLGRGWSHRRSQREQKDRVFRGDGQDATVGTDDGEATVELDMEFYPPLDEDSD